MSSNLFDLSGKTALITGATRGLGLAMATGLAGAGARIIINGHTPSKLDKVIDDLKRDGIPAAGYLFDITNEEDVNKNILEIEKKVGPVDILVNNAAVSQRTKLVDFTLQDFERIIKVDLTGAFIMAKNIVPGMIRRGHGKIINICSMMSELGRDTTGAYAAAKGGLKMLTRSMAAEWAEYNIQINGIGPGYFETELTGDVFVPGNKIYEFIRNRTPAKRWGKPEDLKGSVVFLASEASDFVNGHILYVDGGFLNYVGRPEID
jgi:gluconate 5-dehydrogenase